MDTSTGEQMSNLQVTVNEQPKIKINSRILDLPYDDVFPFLAPEVPPDKINELQAMFDKYKRDEMSLRTFYHLMCGIVGDDQLLYSATATAQFYKSENLPATVNGQPRPRINFRVPMPYEWMLPFLIPEIHQDKATELKALFDKYERYEISRNTLYQLMKDTVGEELLLSVAAKARQKSNIPVTRTQINSSEPLLPFDQIIPFVISRTDPVKAIEIKALFHKYKRGEIAEHIFVPVMKGILGEQMLRIAGEQVKQQVGRVDGLCSAVDDVSIWQLKSTEEQMSNLKLTVNEKPEINSRKHVVPYDRIFPLLIPQIHQDKVKAIQSLFDKYKRDEIPRTTFYSLMTYIVGDEKLILSAAAKVHEQKSNLPVTVNEQPSKRVTFDQRYGFLISQMDADKADEFKTLVQKYKRGEIPKYEFGPLLKGIVGEEMLRSAEETLKQQKSNLPVTVNEQPSKRVTFDQRYGFLISQMDADKADEFKTLAQKYKRGEIPKYEFGPLMKGIVGEEMLRSAEATLKQQKSNLPVTVNEQPRKRVTFDQRYRFLISQMDADKADEFKTLVQKYKRGEIPKYEFGPLMKGIVGEEMLRFAEATLKQQKKNPQGNEQPRTQINSSEPVLPFDQIIPFLISQIDPDNATKLQILFDKYKRGEISEHTFVPVMKGILGEQMLRLASSEVKRQKITNASSSVTSL
ncbi:hypothetical protein P8452_02152 [Trifolium repens]|nr:hypothetical protein P8452_02152 [Trifolium repens]